MIILDTHVWAWWVNGDRRLDAVAREVLEATESTGLGVSVISCWEIAKKAETGKWVLDRPTAEWIAGALAYPGIQVLDLTPAIAIASTMLPSPIQRDPADQIIVATSRELGIPLLTRDRALLAYPHVEHVGRPASESAQA